MFKEDLSSYRLSSMEEPTDDMEEAIVMGMEETARTSTIKVSRRFEEYKAEIVQF